MAEVKTPIELARAVLRELRILRYDDEPDADVANLVKEVYGGLYAEWQIDRIAFWSSDLIPESVFRPVVRLVAAEIAPTFNKPYDAADAKQRLEAAAARGWSGRNVKVQYF